jgi:glucokinase
MSDAQNHLPDIREALVTGIDVGGTKVHIADTLSSTIRRYNTADHPSMEALLEDYFQAIQCRPGKVVVAMAGPPEEGTGAVILTNHTWPKFYPQQASTAYGITIDTENDMVATMAGVLKGTSIDTMTLKPGLAAPGGTKLAVALSTGIGSAKAVWNKHLERYQPVSGEGGHIGWQPKDDEEISYLSHLLKKYSHPSAELALSGKHGIDNLVDHTFATMPTDHLAAAVYEARIAERPVGAILLEYATQGAGHDRQVAQSILKRLGAMLGSVIRDLAVADVAKGGVYLTGSVALGLSEYLAESTEFNQRFVHHGATHDEWLERVPIQLVTDPNVAVVGALALAKEL